MLDYGTFYKHKLFVDGELLPDFASRQRRAAQAIYARILGRCGVDIGMPPIDFIIDVGCGEGSLTRELSFLANLGKKQATSISTIGIDCSLSAIEIANITTTPNLLFIHSEDGFDELFSKLESDHSVVWSRAAVVFLGHTWFHLEQDSILTVIRNRRPALLLIDVYHSWDATIEKLAKKAAEPVLEFGRRDKKDNCTYWLQTRCRSDVPGKVERGIWKTTDGSTGDDWVLPPTEQFAIETSTLFGVACSKEEGDIFTTSRSQGLITGEINTNQPKMGGCDYLVRKVVRHTSGWDEMECHALVPREARARCMNYAYFEVVRNIVRRLFVEDASLGRITNLRSLLALYDEPKEWKNATKFSGSREALIVLPFDPHTHFARAIGLFPEAPDGVISAIDLIVEVPKDWQVRFPTAYGIFHTFEDRVSSPQGFPLDWASDYEHAPIDEAFNGLEAVLLGLREPGPTGKKIEFLDECGKQDKRDPSYFLLPIYFGSLPLFALALKFPILFAPESTDYQVYFSAITNLHAEIKVALTDECIQSELLSPWIAATLDALVIHDTRGEEASYISEACDVITSRLDELEERLFGTIVEVETCQRPFSVAGNRRIGGVLGKDWKSWVLGVPSFSIRYMRSVEAENTRLWKLWQGEKERALLDHELRISYWFEKAKFFESSIGAHDSWKQMPHQERLAALKSIAGIEKFLPSALKKSPYFARSSESYLLAWVGRELNKLDTAANKDDCNHKETCQGDPCCGLAFLNLKAVFCKTLGNKGKRVRFSVRRLRSLIEAALGTSINLEIAEPEGLNSYDYSFCNTYESTFHHVDDPSVGIADFVHLLTTIKVNKGTISAVNTASFKCSLSDHCLQTQLSLSLSEQLKACSGRCGKGGASFADVLDAGEKLGVKEAMFTGNVAGLCICLNSKIENEELSFEITAHSIPLQNSPL